MDEVTGGSNRRRFLSRVGIAITAAQAGSAKAAPDDPAREGQPAEDPGNAILKRAFIQGREYFVLRSGCIRLIAQADQVDLAPAFLWLAFDARDNRQTARKENALNFGNGAGFTSSALQVLLGGFPFTALGHETRTRWVVIDGIPAVEAEWWAGGLLVTEHLFALQDSGVFVRRISLTSRNLSGPEEVKLRLSLPPGACVARDGWLMQENTRARLALACAASVPSQCHPEQADVEIGPLAIPTGGSVTVDTFLSVGILPDDRLPEPPRNLDHIIERTRGAWSAGSSIVTEDATVREAFDKARFGLPAMLSDNGVMDAGIFEYGAQWVRDTSNTLLGLVHAGHFELARNGFVHVLETMVSADGNAMIGSVFADPDREQFDQMGELIHALKSYRDWIRVVPDRDRKAWRGLRSGLLPGGFHGGLSRNRCRKRQADHRQRSTLNRTETTHRSGNMRAVRSSSHLFLALFGTIYLLPAADPLRAGFHASPAEAHCGFGPVGELLFPVWNNGRMQVVHVHVHVKAECVEAFSVASVENARCSIQEPGIARFDVLQRADDPARFILVEVYRTVEAAAAHKATPHYALWRDTVAEMMAEPRTSVKYANLFPNDYGW